MINVILLGFGNVNSHLLRAFSESEEAAVIQVFNRSKIDLNTLNDIPFTSQLSELKDADVYIIGIADDAIASFSEKLANQNKLVVHTSGSAAIDVLSANNRRGVFYLLQTFSKQQKVNFQKIPICIEAENKTDLKLLQKLGKAISNNVVEVSSIKRARLHLAAVFVNNFVNYMYQIGSEILKEDELSFNLLQPLIAETASKIKTLSPSEAQTGPAKRNDKKTIEKHLHLLESEAHKKIYKLITAQLTQKYGKEL
ncbi:MAG: hypothetical protein CL526_09380 [Aequorivita sp.]|nr:hypothetical protein [Aequorivita sp.]|tara:strand:- start:2708 stop:3469 length:762 start_codon:yes stop_codon:yes gene_type:complete